MSVTAIDRRSVLAAVSAVLASAAWAEEAERALQEYEQAVGGRVGLYAENLITEAAIAWRADERFPKLSTFKASLVACVLPQADRGEEGLDWVVTYGQADILDYAPVAKANLANGRLLSRRCVKRR